MKAKPSERDYVGKPRMQWFACSPVLVVLGVMLAPPVARAVALDACTAADIVAQNGSTCPATGPCTITLVFNIGSGCLLDFGTRDVTLAGTGQLNLGAGAVSINAGSFTIAVGGYINGRGDLTNPVGDGANGVLFYLSTSGNVTLQSDIAVIDVSGMTSAGDLSITAGGTVTLAGGHLIADSLTTTGLGGDINITTGGDIITQSLSLISANGGDVGSGSVELYPNGRVALGDRIDVRGSMGGSVDINAGADVVTENILASATSAGDDGGSVNVVAGTQVQMLGVVSADGVALVTGGAGFGGSITVQSLYGDVTVANDLTARGASPDGDGGLIDLNSAGSLIVQSAALLSAQGDIAGNGGTINLTASIGISTSGPLDGSGGVSGGAVNIDAPGDVALGAKVDASGYIVGSSGGSVTALAGDGGQGSLTISNTVDVSAAACSVTGCGVGGATDLEGCGVTVGSTGVVLASGPNGGANAFTAHEQLTISGTVSAANTLATGTAGSNTLTYPSRKPPLVSGTVIPASANTALDTCTALGQQALGGCLDPCPVCGDGIVEYPETCDNGVIPPQNCSGCSEFCQTENCNDGNPCTVDTCDVRLGCLNSPISGCVLPTPTPTGPTATPSITPTVTTTPTRTSTRTNSATPSATPTPSPTWTPTTTPTPATTATPLPPTSTVTITPTPAFKYDSVVLPPAPLKVTIPLGLTSLTKFLKVKVVNADVTPSLEKPGHVIRLVASDGDCPAGTVSGLPDFDLRTPGAQDAALVAGGQAKKAVVPLAISSAAFTSFNLRSPYRCTLMLQAVAVVAGGNADPTPDNDSVGVELNVIDANDPYQTDVHQTVIASIAPLHIRIKKGVSAVTKTVRAVVGNADDLDTAGHAITVTASDGDCPAGTVGAVAFRIPIAPNEPNTVLVAADANASGALSVTVSASAFTTANAVSPRRCTAVLSAAGPSGDADLSNNTAKLIIDVVDRNDF